MTHDGQAYTRDFPEEIRDRLRIDFNEEGGFTARLVGVYQVLGEFSTARLEARGDDMEMACRTLVHEYCRLKDQDRLDIQF